MDYKRYGNTYRLRIDRGEEIGRTIRAFAEREGIANADVCGLGAIGRAVVGLYDTTNKKYIATTFTGDMEVVSLIGSITQKEGEVYLHIHIALSDVSGAVRGGHLTEAVVSGTCELSVYLFEGACGRKFDQDIGLNLLDFPQ